MNTLKSNQYNQASNQTKELKGVTVPREINVKERYHYHVMIVTSKPNPKTFDYTHKVKTQVLNVESFERCKNTYKQVGVGNMIIFHSPVIQKQEEAKAKLITDKEIDEAKKEEAKAEEKALLEKEAKIKAEAKAEAKAEFEAEAKAKAEAEAKKKTPATDNSASKDAKTN